MSEPGSAATPRALIDLDELRKDAQITLDAALATGRERDDAGALLALVGAVEAAQELARAPFGNLVARDFYLLREKLKPFAPGTGASQSGQS